MRSRKTSRALAALLLALGASRAGGDTLFDNGSFRTGIGDGFAGGDTSKVEPGFNAYGFNCNKDLRSGGAPIPFYVADDFVVPACGWSVRELQWYAYQTQVEPGGSTIATINHAVVGLFAVPDAQTRPMNLTPTYGDFITDRFLDCAWTGAWRVSVNAPFNAARAIMEVTIDLSFLPDPLPPGRYWVAVGLAGTLPSGPWAVPVTPSRPPIDNALQWNGQTIPPAWFPIDGNDPPPPNPPVPGGAQDFAFKLTGTSLRRPWDINADCVTDDADLGLVLAQQGLCSGQPDYNPAADVNGDGCIDDADLGLVLAHQGE